MPRLQRRHFMALDEVYEYFQTLQLNAAKPSLYKICSALRTLDKAIDSSWQEPLINTPLSIDAWSAVRDKLFDLLISSFPGYFVIFADGQDMPLTAGQPWPNEGRLEFYPQLGQRREDSYHAWLERIDAATLTSLRICFAEGRQYVSPADFNLHTEDAGSSDISDTMAETAEQCRREAQKGKKRAHQKWWQLYWESNSCLNKSQKHELRRQMDQLQDVWGRPG
jgi:hypothetical protein